MYGLMKILKLLGNTGSSMNLLLTFDSEFRTSKIFLHDRLNAARCTHFLENDFFNYLEDILLRQ